jgi:hypothetical protein
MLSAWFTWHINRGHAATRLSVICRADCSHELYVREPNRSRYQSRMRMQLCLTRPIIHQTDSCNLHQIWLQKSENNAINIVTSLESIYFDQGQTVLHAEHTVNNYIPLPPNHNTLYPKHSAPHINLATMSPQPCNFQSFQTLSFIICRILLNSQ